MPLEPFRKCMYSPRTTSPSLTPLPHTLCAFSSWSATSPTSGALGRTHIMKKGPAHRSAAPWVSAELGGDHENHPNCAAYSQRRLAVDPCRRCSTDRHKMVGPYGHSPCCVQLDHGRQLRLY